MKMSNLSLFCDELALLPSESVSSIKTEGIKYAGSKKKLLPQILSLAKKVNAKTVLDGFSGTTRVSQAFSLVVITSLINALDKVDSTLGHFVSYLNEWSSRSYSLMNLEMPAFLNQTQDHKVVRSDIFDLLPQCSVDLAYFDPPYGSNNEKMPPSRVRYSAYYHVWTSICNHDKPEVFGKAKRRIETSDKLGASVFEEFRKNSDGQLIAVQAIEKLLNEVNAKHVILSYSSGGRATAEQLNSAISKSGEIIEILEVDHKKNVMADMRWTSEWVRDAETPNKEFLFLIRKSRP